MFTLTYNNQPIAPATPTPHVPGARLAFAGPWPGVQWTLDYVGQKQPAYSATNRHDLGELPGPGKYRVEVGKFDGSEWWGATVVLTAAVAPIVAPPAVEVRAEPMALPAQALTRSFDGGGKTYVPEKIERWAAQFSCEGNGHTLSDLTIARMPGAPDPYDQLGIHVRGHDWTLDRIRFADGTGYPIKVNGHRCKLRDVEATTFRHYALYAEHAKDIDVDGFRVRGGSSYESIVRLDESTGVLRNLDLDYSSIPRKACLRGSFTGRIEHGRCAGAIVGVNPLEGMDGGQAYGWYKFLGRAGILTADNVDACRAAVNAAILGGEEGPTELCHIAVAVARLNGKPLDGVDVPATVKRRATDLANASNVDWLEFRSESGIRWGAGTTYRYKGGAVGADAYGSNFVNVATTYPEPKWLLPGDVPRIAPKVSFTGTTFTSPKSIGDFIASVARLGVTLDGCRYNGTAVGT